MFRGFRTVSALAIAMCAAIVPAASADDTVSRLVHASGEIHRQGERALVTAARACAAHLSPASAEYAAFQGEDDRLEQQIIELENQLVRAHHFPDGSRDWQAVGRLQLFQNYTYNGGVMAVDHCRTRFARDYYVIARELLGELHRIDTGAGDPRWKAPSRGLVPDDAKMFDEQ